MWDRNIVVGFFSWETLLNVTSHAELSCRSLQSLSTCQGGDHCVGDCTQCSFLPEFWSLVYELSFIAVSLSTCQGRSLSWRLYTM